VSWSPGEACGRPGRACGAACRSAAIFFRGGSFGFLSAVARFGLIARGLVLCGLGYFLFRAADEGNPDRVQSMGGTLRTLSHAALGPVFTGIIAFGLAAYGVYLWTLMLLKRRV
jgi:hypothetical protein